VFASIEFSRLRDDDMDDGDAPANRTSGIQAREICNYQIFMLRQMIDR